MAVPSIPDWMSQALPAERAHALADVLQQLAAEHGLSFGVEGHTLVLAHRGTAFGRLNIDGVVAAAAGTDAESVREALDPHFARCAVRALVTTTEELLERLRVRLHPSSAAIGQEATLPALPGTVAAMMIDYGRYRFPLHAAAWGRLAPDVQAHAYALALARTVAELRVERSEDRLASGATLALFTGDDHATSTLALVAEQKLAADPRFGVLVASPRSQIVIAHAIGHADVLGALARMAISTRGIHSEGPEPLVSREVYWVRGATCEVVDMDVDLANRRVSAVRPSSRFADEVVLPLAGSLLTRA